MVIGEINKKNSKKNLLRTRDVMHLESPSIVTWTTWHIVAVVSFAICGSR
jgi:hypothetical protein